MKYLGNRFLNYNTILITVFYTIISLGTIESGNYEIPLFLTPLFYIAYITEAFYFELNKNVFLIKNYALPFFKREYKLSEVNAVLIINVGHRYRSRALRIVSNETKSSAYSSMRLRIKDWQLLIKDLRELNIETNVDVYELNLKYTNYDKRSKTKNE
jgi:hypothetical protein